MEPGDFVAPMLAVRADQAFSGACWWFETKWDGYRAVISIGEQFHIYSRNGQDLLTRFPSLSATEQMLPRDIVLDAELVAWVDGRPSFADLQTRTAATYLLMVFDCLYQGGRWIMHEPWAVRHEILRRNVSSFGQIVVSDGVFESGSDFFTATRALELEGVIAKRRDSPYLPGRRSPLWQKFLVYQTGWFWILNASQSPDGSWYWTVAERDSQGWRKVARVKAPKGWRWDERPVYLPNDPRAVAVELSYRDRTREGQLRHARIRRWGKLGALSRLEDPPSGTGSLSQDGNHPRGGG